MIYKKNIFLLFIIVALIIPIVVIRNYYQAKINRLEKDLANLKEIVDQQKKQPLINASDIQLAAEKNKIIGQAPAGNIYYSASQPVKATDGLWKIKINLIGQAGVLADAADFQLEFPPSIKIINILEGDAFPLYPRKIINAGSLIITGAASIDNNQIQFGQAGKHFATIELDVLPTVSLPVILAINPDNTNIFLSGKNIIDKNNSITEIKIK